MSWALASKDFGTAKREGSQLLQDYFDEWLDWNQQIGWDKLIDISIWNIAIYESDQDMVEAMSRLKEVLGEGAPYTNYAQVDAFFEPIRAALLQKYGRELRDAGVY